MLTAWRQRRLGGAMAGLVWLILIGCEVLRKRLAVRKPEQWALRVAPPLLLLQTLATPLRRVAQRINAAILKAVIPKSVVAHSSLTDADYQELLELAFQQGRSRNPRGTSSSKSLAWTSARRK